MKLIFVYNAYFCTRLILNLLASQAKHLLQSLQAKQPINQRFWIGCHGSAITQYLPLHRLPTLFKGVDLR